jgi:hypothetical protein
MAMFVCRNNGFVTLLCVGESVFPHLYLDLSFPKSIRLQCRVLAILLNTSSLVDFILELA